MAELLNLSFQRMLSAQLARRPDARSKSWLVIRDPAEEGGWQDITAWAQARGLDAGVILTQLNNEGFAVVEFDDAEAAHEACRATEADADGRPGLRFDCTGWGFLSEAELAEAPWLEKLPDGGPHLLTENT